MPDTKATNARHDSEPPAGSLPFFARFLEAQNEESTTEDGSLQATPPRKQTLKYPSDRDEWWDNRSN